MTTQIPQFLEQCRGLIFRSEKRVCYLRQLQDVGFRITGYFSNYIPAEIIATAGFHPVRMIGRYESSESCNQSLMNPVCSFARDTYDAACSGSLSHFDKFIFPNSCDSLKVLQQMWSANPALPAAYTLLHPINADSHAVQYFTDQIKAMADWLKQQGGKGFTQDDLLSVVQQYNHTRDLLRRIYQLRLQRPNALAGSDLFTLMTAGLIMKRDEYNHTLQKVLAECQDNSGQSDQKRVMIIGPLLDNIDLIKTIESFDACIVADEVTNGWRYFDQNVQTEGDLYENLAARYLRAGPSPTLNTDPQAMLASFRDRVSKLDIDGVIYINQKFCEPHVHHYMAKSEILRDMNINCLLLEIEHRTQKISERDLLRIESFIEVV